MNKKETMEAVKTLISIYDSRTEADTPADTLKKAAAEMGAEKVRDTLAALVIANADDGRIARDTLTKARAIGSAYAEGEYLPRYADIHRAHLDQLAAYMFAHFDEIRAEIPTEPEKEEEPEKADNLRTPATMTAEELDELRKKNAAYIQELDKRAEAIREEWESVPIAPLSKRLNTPIMERLTKKTIETEEAKKHAQKIAAILRNNYRVKRWEEIRPILIDILTKYEGKPYGEKTAEKMKNELFIKKQCYFYIERSVPYYLYIQEADADGFTRNGEKFNIVAAGAGLAYLNADNKITPPPVERLQVYGLKPYIENPEEMARNLDEKRARAEKLTEELRALVRDYNDAAPEGFNRLETPRI